MLTNVVLGSNDMERSRVFYDAVLGSLGMNRLRDVGSISMWGTLHPSVIVRPPLDGRPATFANGGTIGFSAPGKQGVDAFHAAALAHGGSCEGVPGPRVQSGGMYGAYIRDPDGNKMSAYAVEAD